MPQGVPELHLKNFQIAQLIKFHMPGFFAYLRRIQMTPDFFTSKWFMTLFACFLPFALLTPIFDMFLLEGWRAVFRIGIALLRILEPEVSRMDMVELCTYFRERVRSEKVANEFQLFSMAARVRVNKILVNCRSPSASTRTRPVRASVLPVVPFVFCADPQQGAGEASRKVLHHPGPGEARE